MKCDIGVTEKLRYGLFRMVIARSVRGSFRCNVLVMITTTIPQSHLDGNMCQGGVAGGVIIGPRPSYGPEGGDKVELIEPEQKFPTRILKTCGEK